VLAAHTPTRLLVSQLPSELRYLGVETVLDSKMWAQATTFFSKVKDGITNLADQQYKEFTTELKRNDALKREKKRQEDLRKKVIPPWVALDESKAILEDPVKEKILQLSKEERTFLVPAPEEVCDCFPLDETPNRLLSRFSISNSWRHCLTFKGL